MKKTITLILLIPQLFFGQTTQIPDSNFEQALISLGYDSGVIDGEVLTSNISSITLLDISAQNISDLTGIGDFVALTYLLCHNNQITTIDVSQNTNLILLDCHLNQITSLDVSQNIPLEVLACYNNQLTSLDVSQNTNLTDIRCDHNQLTILDLSQNTDLTYLSCSYNQLTNLDISLHTNLTYLSCYNNQLTSLDLSQNNDLEALFCSYNQLTCLNLKNSNYMNFWVFASHNNPNLSCVEVIDLNWATQNWTSNVDMGVTFSTNCNYPSNCFSNSTIIHEIQISSKTYPNPTKHVLHIVLNNEVEKKYILTIYDNLGRKVHGSSFINDGEIELDVSNFKYGIYHYQLLCPTQSLRTTGKFIKN